MTEFKGKGVYGAVAVGKACVFSRSEMQVRRIHIKDTKKEIERVEAAKETASQQLSVIYEEALKKVGEEHASIFEIHKMMLQDDTYNDSIRNIINTQSVNAEFAIAVTSDNYSDMFTMIEDEYLRARAADIRDISDRLIYCLSGAGRKNTEHTEKVIICTDDLAPSDTVMLDREHVLAFVTAYGSQSSHTAILARCMGIPAVIGVGDDFLRTVKNGAEIIADGHTGKIYIEPDAQTKNRLIERQAEDNAWLTLFTELKGKRNITLDGTSVNICAVINSMEEIVSALTGDAGGIGLFGSEFIYKENNGWPSEDIQFKIYKKMLESMAGKKVIIRTLDTDPDKPNGAFGLENEDNPALGTRGIRIYLSRPEIFRTQMRALYRASAFGNLAIVFPMITSVPEIEMCLEMCGQVKAELKAEGIRYNDDTQVGIMIETPAAAMISDKLAHYADFFCINTNDLTQYTLACDRQNPKLEAFIDSHHEAVLRLIEMTAKNAHAGGAWIGVSGALAADMSLTETFLKMGIDELSVPSSLILPLRKAIREMDLRN